MKLRIFSPHFTIAKPDASPYLRRWFLTPWSSDDHRLKDRRLPNVYLHQILRSDDDRALHDHPWDNISIILWGGYVEHVFERPPVEGMEMPPVTTKRRRMFSIVRRKAEDAHRLELYRTKPKQRCYKTKSREQGGLAWGTHYVVRTFPKDIPCWSIFITWRKRREWGFWCEKRGLTGEVSYPLTTPGGAVNYVLQYTGAVACWVHQAIFCVWGGPTLAEPMGDDESDLVAYD